MKKYLTYKDEKSDKFWQVEVTGAEHTVTYGKTGTAGSSKTKTFDSDAICLADAQKVMQQKIKKGYIDAEGTESSTDKAPSKIITKKEIAPEKITPKEIEEIKIIEVTTIKDPASGITTIENLIQRNELIKAGNLCEQLLTLKLSKEQTTIAYYLQGNIAFLKSDLEAAEEALKQGGAASYFLLGELYKKQENFPEAFLHYTKADSYHSYWTAGLLAKKKRMQKKAIKYFKLAIEKAGEEKEKLWEPYLMLGASYHTTEPKLAEESYVKSIENNPANDHVFSNLAILYITEQHYEESIKVLDLAIDLFPKQPLAHFNKCCVFTFLGKLDEANKSLEKALYNGYNDRINLKNDKDLEELRKTDVFKQLIEKYAPENHYTYDFKYNAIKEQPEVITDLTLYSLTKDNKLPAGIAKAHNIKKLSVEGNLKVFPSEICELHKLEKLTLRETSIHEFPEEFLNMDIKTVELEIKRITHFPSELSRQKGLTNLQLSSPKFDTVPKEIAHFSSLNQLCIKHAKQLQSIDNEIGSLTNLRSLEIRDTTLKNVPKEIGEINQLYSLTISENPDIKYLPESIFMLPKLENAFFHNNGFPSTEATKLYQEGQKNKTDKRLLAIFLAILQDNKPYIKEHAQQTDVLQALNSSVKMLRNNALIWLSKQNDKNALDEKSEVLVLGKFDSNITEMKKKIAEMGIAVAKKWTISVTHILIGEKPGDKLPPLLSKTCHWVTEEQLKTNNETETANTAVELTDMMKQQIKTLLISTEETNNTMALEMIEASGSTLLFAIELFLVCQFSGDKTNKKAILSLIKQTGDQKLQTVFAKKYGFRTATEKKIKEYIAKIPLAAGFDENEFAYTIFKKTKEKAIDYLFENGSTEQRKEVLKTLIKDDTLKFDSDSTITVLPEELGNFTELKDLKVFFLKLKEFPLFLTRLLKLENINFCKTRIKKLPKEISNFTKIKTLDLASCSFKKFPIETYALQSLETLLLGVHGYESSSQSITVIPEGISNLKQLKKIDLAYNGVTTLPNDFAKLDSLEDLNLHLNSIKELPENFASLKSLRILKITCVDKDFQSDFTNILAKIDSLEKLYISTIQLEAFKNLSKLTNLKELVIHGKNLNDKDWVGEASKQLPNCKISTSFYG